MTKDSLKQKTGKGFEMVMAVIAALLVFGAVVNAHAAIPTAERNALIDLYNSTDGANWNNRTNWLGAAGTECSWYGVVCSGDNVTEINLTSNNLNGTIPSSVGNFASLQSLDLGDNQLEDNIPLELSSLSNLQTLDLARNRLEGNIPLELSFLSNLQALYLSDNQLTGDIPSELGNLSNLQTLYLDDNQLTGNIPPELGRLSNLQHLCLYNNQLIGSIPPELGNLSNLEQLRLNACQLTGNIPPELGNLSVLLVLNLYNNQLTGSIPSELGSLSSLHFLDLSRNQLSGSIPSELGSLQNLQELDLSENHFSESIPWQIENLLSLQRINLSENKLSGEVPLQMINLIAMTDERSDFRWNALYTNDSDLSTFLNAKQMFGIDWESTQTVAPANLATGTLTPTSIPLSWAPIVYTGDSGGYEIYYSTTSGGPYSVSVTASKSESYITVASLTPGTTYYFRIRTVTNSHANNPNTLHSGYTDEVYATTANDPPVIAQIDPSRGPASGGTTITILGAHFSTSATVTLGGVEAISTSVLATKIVCQSPVHEPGIYDVTVINPGETDLSERSATCEGCYRYDPPPTVTQITPTYGAASGNTEVTIKGFGFVEGTTVKFGDQMATNVSLVSSSQITCTAPEREPATVDITVTNPDGQSATREACFIYTPPLIAKIDSPSSHTVITEGESINFQGSVTGENAPFTHSWDFDNGAINSASEDPGDISFNKKGSYTVTFTVTDTKGNTASDSLIVTVLNESPSEAAIVTEHETICNGDSANLIFILPKNTSPFDVEYTDGTLNDDGTLKRYALTDISNGYAINVSPTSITTYSLISVTGADGRIDRPSSSVTISPDVSGIWGSLKVGPGEVKKYSIRETPDASYQWTVTGGTIISGQGDAGERTTFNDEEVNQIRVQWGDNGGKISVTETNAAGCQHTGRLSVSPYFSPEIGRDFAQFRGQATIDGQPPQTDTWIAAFDQEGNCVGTDKLMIIDDTAYISLYIYGDDPETAYKDGMRENEPFTLQLESETGRLEHGLSFTWQPTGGSPLPGYDNSYLCNFESGNRVKRDGLITRNVPRGSPFPIPSLTLEAGRFLGQATVNGVSAEKEDWIAALDENGRCVGANKLIINNGIAYIGLMIYGPFANNTFTLQLYDVSAANEGSENPYLDIDCATPPCLFIWKNADADNIPAYSNFLEDYNFSSPMDFSEISLNKGWNLISFDVESRSTSASDILSALIGENDPNRCLYMRTFVNDPTSGQYGVILFDPYGPNTLEIEKGYGYWIKTCQDVTLELLGKRIDPDYRPELNPGLNLVMYNGPDIGQSPEAYFLDLINAGDLEYIKGFEKDGFKTYNPDDPPFLNDLDRMKRGSGYRVKVKGQPDLEVPCDLHPHPSIFGVLKGEVRLEGKPAEENDWVLAFDSEGNCAGAELVKIDKDGTAYMELVIHSDDGSSSEDEGIGPGDYFTLKLYKASEDGGRYITYPEIFSGWSGSGLPLRDITDVYDFVECGNLILIAGGGKDTQDPLYASTQYLSDMVYSKFLIRGFRDEEIYYFNPEPFHDIDGDGTSDPVFIDYTPSVTEFRQAIETWAVQQTSTGPLYLVMINHGGMRTFEIYPGEVITADELDESLTSFQNATGRDVVVIMEACKSGSFVDNLVKPGSDRMVITCTNEKDAYLGRNGYISFINFLMGELYLGKTFAESFNTAKAQLTACGTPYSRMAPQLAESSLSGEQLGGNFAIAGPSPEFLNQPENRTTEAGTIQEFSISVSSYGENNEVWAVVKPPNYEPPPVVEDLETPEVSLPIFELTDEDGDSIFTGTYGGFANEGEHSIIFYARNPDGLVSISQPTMITVTTCGTDLNHNSQTDIGDAILGLKALAGFSTPEICGGDISGDGKVGLAEIISVLREIAGLK